MPSGETRARARSLITRPDAPIWWSDTKAGPTLATPSRWGDEVFALHILPSGIVRKGVTNVIGNGVIVDLISLDREIAELEGRGKTVEGLRISDRANVILNWHRLLDGAEERLRGNKTVGTTGKGIGPCYSDKIARSGIRMGDLLDPELLEERLDTVMPMKLKVMDILGVRLAQNKEELFKELLAYGGSMRSSSPTPRYWSTPLWTRERTCCSRVPRARCWTSTTAPIRSLHRPTV